MYLQAPPGRLVPIDEGPEERDHLQAPGQLSDADDEDPWIPDPHKPKAARSLNFDLHVTTDVHMAHPAEPAEYGHAAADVPTEQGRPNTEAKENMQTGHKKLSQEPLSHDAVPDPENAASDKYLQPQHELHGGKGRESAVVSKTPTSAQRRKEQVAQQRQQPELSKEGGKVAKTSLTETAAGRQGKAANQSHAYDSRPQQTTKNAYKTMPNPGAPARIASQVLLVHTLLFHLHIRCLLCCYCVSGSSEKPCPSSPSPQLRVFS